MPPSGSPAGSCARAPSACILAEYLAGRGHLDEAARQLQDAARAGDLRHAGRSALALAFLPDSDPRWLKLADQYLAEALKQQPGSAELLQEQAYVRRLRSRPEDQVKIYEAILVSHPFEGGYPSTRCK